MAARTRPIRTIVACLIFPPKWKAVAWRPPLCVLPTLICLLTGGSQSHFFWRCRLLRVDTREERVKRRDLERHFFPRRSQWDGLALEEFQLIAPGIQFDAPA